MFGSIVGQLKALKRVRAPEPAMARMRARLLAAVSERPMIRPATAAIPVPAFAWKPLVASLVGAAVISASGAVYAAQGALPGEPLYGVKLLSEAVPAGLSTTPTSKFKVKAGQAERRLQEAAAVSKKNDLSAAEKVKRVKEAMKRYENSVAELDKIAPDLKAAGSSGLEAAGAVERVLDRHESLADSASGTDEADEETVVMPMKKTVELEKRVLETVKDGDDDKSAEMRGKLENKLNERRGKLENRLQKLRVQHAGGKQD